MRIQIDRQTCSTDMLSWTDNCDRTIIDHCSLAMDRYSLRQITIYQHV